MNRQATTRTQQATKVAPIAGSILQRKCVCGQHTVADGECESCRRKGLTPQRAAVDSSPASEAPPIVHEVLRSRGQPLDLSMRAFMEPRFGHDFGRVRVHTDERATQSARAVNALAYTVGRNIVFASGAFRPETSEGSLLLAHELTHTIQQGAAGDSKPTPSPAGDWMGSEREVEAELAATNLIAGRLVANVVPGTSPLSLQRQVHGTPSPVSVRSPVFEELVTQVSTSQAGLTGRSLTPDEVRLARSVFGDSIDYSRVRLIPTGVLEYRTVANTIRVPEDFTIGDEYMAQTLIHELTHVWQYQHGGTSYISVSLATQIAGTIRTGSRNAAYDYRIIPGASFFDFTPEQQGLIVENYFSMLRDQGLPSRARYAGNHLDSSGQFQILSETDRRPEISRELPLHQPLIKQMQTALPRSEVDLLSTRASEVMRTPFEDMAPVREELRVAPVKPLLEMRF